MFIIYKGIQRRTISSKQSYRIRIMNVKHNKIKRDYKSMDDAPPSSLMDSTTSPKVKIVEEKELGRIPWLVTLWA
jgi:hypothetical protein